jgi:predicted SAM-dependent methyltransferase
MNLHIGGKVRHPDWKILDITPGDHVDFGGDAADLSQTS